MAQLLVTGHSDDRSRLLSTRQRVSVPVAKLAAAATCSHVLGSGLKESEGIKLKKGKVEGC